MMRTKILVFTFLTFATLMAALPFRKATATSTDLRAERSHSAIIEEAVFKDVDRYKFIPHHKKAVVPSKAQPTFPLKQETPVVNDVADLDDFRACYEGCRGFGGSVLQCTIICAPTILRDLPDGS